MTKHSQRCSGASPLALCAELKQVQKLVLLHINVWHSITSVGSIEEDEMAAFES